LRGTQAQSGGKGWFASVSKHQSAGRRCFIFKKENKLSLHLVLSQQAPNSLEVIIEYLIKLAEDRTREARALADAKNVDATAKCDDLEATQVRF
jgi:hypothetical protein